MNPTPAVEIIGSWDRLALRWPAGSHPPCVGTGALSAPAATRTAVAGDGSGRLGIPPWRLARQDASADPASDR